MLLIFPLRFGGTAVTIETPGPAALLDAIARHKSHRPRHRADRLQGDPRPAERARHFDAEDLRLGRRASPGRNLARVARRDRHRDRRRHRRDRDDAHLHLRRAATTSAPARPARRCRAMSRRVLDDEGRADGRQGIGRLAVQGARPAAAISTIRARPTMSTTAGTSPATPTAATRTAISGTSPARTT